MDDDVENLGVGLFALNREDRTVRGVLVPWGEQSRLSVSKTKPVRFDGPQDLRVPRDVSIVGLNRLHDRFDPLGRAVELDSSSVPAGLVATFRIADTPEGDEWLAEPGNLRRLSAEVRNMRRRADGSATAELVGAALVDEGAFASAALFAVDAVDSESHTVNEYTDEEGNVWRRVVDVDSSSSTEIEDDGTITTTSTTTVVEVSEPAEPETPEEGNNTVEEEVPNTFSAGDRKAGNRPVSAGEMFAIMSARASGTATADQRRRFVEARGDVDESALFALSDVDYDGAAGVGAQMTQPAWLGEVVDGTQYLPRFFNLFGSRDLTALAMSGWKWGVRPQGGTWAGNKADIPSNTPTIVPVSENAQRWAGGHDHAREHRDFNTPGYFESYYAAMTEDFFRWLDEDVVLTDVLAAATEIEADNPAGLAIGAAMSGLIDGAAAVVDAGLLPTFAVLPTAGWKSILKTPNSDVLGYLNAQLGLDEGTLENNGFVIRGSSGVTNTIVGSRSAADVYTLPGSPIRVEALDVARGGIDTGLFGYGGLNVLNPAGIVEVTPYTP